MTRAHISPDGAVVRYADDGAPAPLGWTDLSCVDVGLDLPIGPAEHLAGPVVTVTTDALLRAWSVEPLPLEMRRATKVGAIDAERDRRLGLGALHEGRRFSMSDTSRTDLGGMATTAALVLAGALPWPESYAQGWISLDNSRLPLPTPAEGIALAAVVGVTYSAIVQHARTLKDAALAGDPAVVDEADGWPE